MGTPTRHSRPIGAGEAAEPIRRILLALVVLGIVGLEAELLLLEHVESWTQWIPLVALAGGLVAAMAAALRPTRAALRVFQGVMALFIAAGVLGVILHYRGNVEFEVESDPAARGIDLIWRSLRGATPALAPGAMAQLGLLGLAYTFRHPALRRGPDDQPQERQ